MRIFMFVLLLSMPNLTYADTYLSGLFGDLGAYSGDLDAMTLTLNYGELPAALDFTNGTYCEGKCIFGTLESQTFTFLDGGYKFQLAFNPDWTPLYGGSFLKWNFDGRFYNTALLVSESYIGTTPEPATLYLVGLLMSLIPCFRRYFVN